MNKQNEPNILLDSDVVIHFTKAGHQLVLPKVFPGRFVILDKVHEELNRRHSEILPIRNFLNWCKIPVLPFPTDRDVHREYAMLKSKMGEGEAACLAVARYQKEYVASSNLTDIFEYCAEHSIFYYTTMDILLEAYDMGLLSEAECDKFIFDVKSKKSKLIEGIDKIEHYKLKKTRGVQQLKTA